MSNLKLKSGERVILKEGCLDQVLEKIVEEALNQIESKDRDSLTEEVEFRKVIGMTACVEISEKNRIIYIKRPGEMGYSKFVFAVEPQPCHFLTVVLEKIFEGTYILSSFFVGKKRQPEPWENTKFSEEADPAKAQKKSLQYWGWHAFCWKPGYAKKTFKCPWELYVT